MYGASRTIAIRKGSNFGLGLGDSNTKATATKVYLTHISGLFILSLSIAHMLPYSVVGVSVWVIHDVHEYHKQKLQRDHKATCVEWKERKLKKRVQKDVE